MIGPRSRQIVRGLRVLRSALLVEIGLRVRPLEDLAGRLGITLGAEAPVSELPSSSGPEARAQARWAVYAADRLLRWVPGGPYCLRRALIAGHLLRDHAPVLRIGSARRDGQLAFHAWLEVGGEVVVDRAATEFRPLVRRRAMG
jgi:hypothetical protein